MVLTFTPNRIKRTVAMIKPIVIASILLAASAVHGQADQRKIEAFRRIYAETNRSIAEAEKNFPESDIALSELTVNSGGTMYPAVGNYKQVIRFYYTYGNRELSPYPNRLLKVTLTTERAAVRESAEYYFAPSGLLVFALETDPYGENRYYFDQDVLFRWQAGSRTVDPKPPTPPPPQRPSTAEKNGCSGSFSTRKIRSDPRKRCDPLLISRRALI